MPKRPKDPLRKKRHALRGEADRVLGVAGAKKFMSEPQPVLGNRTPKAVAKTDPERIRKLLDGKGKPAPK